MAHKTPSFSFLLFGMFMGGAIIILVLLLLAGTLFGYKKVTGTNDSAAQTSQAAPCTTTAPSASVAFVNDTTVHYSIVAATGETVAEGEWTTSPMGPEAATREAKVVHSDACGAILMSTVTPTDVADGVFYTPNANTVVRAFSLRTIDDGSVQASDPVEVFNGVTSEFAWSTDYGRFAFASRDGKSVADASVTDPRHLEYVDIPVENGQIGSIFFSPDGDKLAVLGAWSDTAGAHSTAFVVNLADGSVRDFFTNVDGTGVGFPAGKILKSVAWTDDETIVPILVE